MPALADPLPVPEHRTRRRSDADREGRQARDRLITTLTLAALLHALVILGVTFKPPGSHGDTNQGMEVLLVSNELPEARHNDSATYLSQRTQLGSGNTRERLPARLPGAHPAEAASPPGGRAGAREQMLQTSAPAHTRLQMMALATGSAGARETSSDVQRQKEPKVIADDTLRLRGETRDELYVTADTRASRLAPYLDGWRKRVERIGTVNYPSIAQRRGLSGNPVIEVALQRDGKLKSVRIQRSSGHPEIDAAALDILRLASPFDPFPPELARDYLTMRFAYEWRFEGGAPVRGAISVP